MILANKYIWYSVKNNDIVKNTPLNLGPDIIGAYL